jgi:Rps23 Pro-64 3,4-dihydroxylase Tpa1-like proline 4-hydroxylase
MVEEIENSIVGFRFRFRHKVHNVEIKFGQQALMY